MSLDIYKQINPLVEQELFNSIGINSKSIMGLESISSEEKDFIEKYSIRLQKEQSKVNKDEVIVYTKITMGYAVKYKLTFLQLVFHPCSLARRQYYQNEETKDLAKVFERIIVWETTNEKTYLTQDQLEAVIKHFRLLEFKSGV